MCFLLQLKRAFKGLLYCEISNSKDMAFFTAKRQKLDIWKVISVLMLINNSVMQNRYPF